MQITSHIYSTHIEEDPSTFGAMHPGGTQIYFVGDPSERMVVVDSGEPYRSWTRQILDYHTELGRPRISAILITHGHGDHIGGLDRLQESFDCEVRCHPKLEPRLTHQLGQGIVRELAEQETVETGGGVSLRAWHTPGHEDDHIAYHLLADGAVFSGDTILGNSSSSVRNLKQYMESLETLARLNPGILCPGHGQVIRDGAAGSPGTPGTATSGRSRCWRRCRKGRSQWTKSLPPSTPATWPTTCGPPPPATSAPTCKSWWKKAGYLRRRPPTP